MSGMFGTQVRLEPILVRKLDNIESQKRHNRITSLGKKKWSLGSQKTKNLMGKSTQIKKTYFVFLECPGEWEIQRKKSSSSPDC